MNRRPIDENASAARKSIGTTSGNHSQCRVQKTRKTESGQYRAHGNRVRRRHGRRPECFAPDHVLQADLRGELPLPRLLIPHPHEGGEQRLEKGGHEGGVRQNPRPEIGEVIQRMPLPSQGAHLAAKSDTERQQQDQGLAPEATWPCASS